MKFLIVTGMSGAGKSQAVNMLEDMGYYCVDNMVVELIVKFAELCLAAEKRYQNVAIVVDVRAGDTFGQLNSALAELTAIGCEYSILFIEASTDVIIHRYKETRRRHPLTIPGATLEDTVEEERRMLAGIRGSADYVIDTSGTNVARLHDRLVELFDTDRKKSGMVVHIISFGFKFGIPAESDLLFDVRFLPNPYYLPELRPKTGFDSEVYDYVLESEVTKEFLHRLIELVDFLLPMYVEEGKSSLVISIGCTGGQHRSVALTEYLTRHIERQLSLVVETNHRDVFKKANRPLGSGYTDPSAKE